MKKQKNTTLLQSISISRRDNRSMSGRRFDPWYRGVHRNLQLPSNKLFTFATITYLPHLSSSFEKKISLKSYIFTIKMFSKILSQNLHLSRLNDWRDSHEIWLMCVLYFSLRCCVFCAMCFWAIMCFVLCVLCYVFCAFVFEQREGLVGVQCQQGKRADQQILNFGSILE